MPFAGKPAAREESVNEIGTGSSGVGGAESRGVPDGLRGNGMVFIQAITGADPENPIGATALAGVGKQSGRVAAPPVTLTTTRPDSLVEAVGADWSNPTPRTIPAGQVILHEDVSTPNGDDYWAQGFGGPVATPGSVTLSVTDPADDDCNMAAVEILPAP